MQALSLPSRDRAFQGLTVEIDLNARRGRGRRKQECRAGLLQLRDINGLAKDARVGGWMWHGIAFKVQRRIQQRLAQANPLGNATCFLLASQLGKNNQHQSERQRVA